ncbi:beta-1,4-N-acetylgalactosaminyltransferase bre-4-like [Ostrinia furnacalis]|uniref:beta-1,4-N-acetylgalactosaminyltransferase bre-4-like n=1 Tax=Ostrinia furnacalis TaxID=93504 RepID=UPI0010391947|nr:beta-1,4-N-acetylgalactosaminyltransferase bre-4-like [Ostrinia furnacalis]XP_028162017.1 beta-1,4-N-acetylgalactosaminyltransferase bre-4-like [Ostrinia furnacalis]
MPKWLLKRLLKVRISTCVSIILCLIGIICLLSYKGEYNYKHIPRDAIQHELYKEISPNLELKKTKPDCTYDEILSSKESIQNWQLPTKFDDFSAAGISNGSFTPEHCNPLFSVAILVTYRNRQSQLDIFLPYMHNFLRKQNIHYKIFLIEQQDNKNFNKGLLYNIGARVAMSEKFPCLVLHDVDTLPLDAANLYACLRQPRHLSASIDKFRFVLPYSWLVGGVLAVRADHYAQVNGFSNRYEKWGGEDDDFSMRIENNGLQIYRLPVEMSRYTMLMHPPAAKNEQRGRLLADSARRGAADGLSSARYDSLRVTRARLVTQLAVRL